MTILADAAELPVDGRSEFLDSVCLGEPELRREIEELLECADSASTAFAAAAQQIVQPDPDQIGPYQIVEPIGEGGMAIVYRAQQQCPVKRTVALKLIKLGMDTRQFVARFEGERQALAMMDHPNVARVYDAGSTDTGRPYFVMEHVPGLPILKYCDEQNLSLRARLTLFVVVCEAVEHAHRKGIIHRDLKDSNVLVTEVDGKPVPKVIDFGVAKAIQQRLTERTFQTEQGQLIGTPEYMSPEQADRGTIDIDTRSDVYSLGVLLYELIAGVQPISSELLRRAGYEQVQRIIRETETPRPSTRLSTLGGADATRIAQRRRTALPTLIRNLRSELEWIPLKAMRKDREQRYRSAAELADDVRNYLDGRPLIAGPESARYKLRKLLRRHKGVVAASALMMLLLLGGIAATSWQAVRAARERDNAEATLKFLTDDVLAGATPESIPDASVRDQIVRAMIAPAASRVGKSFKDRPLTEASIRETIRSVLVKIGRRDLALPHAEAALAIRRRELGDDHPDTLTSLNNYASVLEKIGRVHEAESVYRDALERRRRLLGEDHPKTLMSLNNYAHVLYSLGRYTEAAPAYQEALERRRRVLGEDDPDTVMSVNNYASVLESLDRPAEAEPLYKQAMENYRRQLGDDHPQTLTAMSNVANVLNSLDRVSEAEAMQRQVLERRRRVLGADHPDTLFSLDQYALMLTQLGRAAEAAPLATEALERRRRVLGADHPHTIWSMNDCAVVLRSVGRLAEAEAHARQAVDKATASASLGPKHPLTRASAGTLATCLNALGRHTEAAAVRKEFGLPEPTGASTRPSTQPTTKL
jgi:serine/threonine protein kinase